MWVGLAVGAFVLVVGVGIGILLARGGGTPPPVEIADRASPAAPAPDPEPAGSDPTSRSDDLPDEPSDDASPLDAEELGRRYGDAVWRVDVEGCGITASGTAFAVAPNLFVTNAHVINIDPAPLLTARDGYVLEGTVIGYRDWPDIAVIEVDEPLGTFLEWAPADELNEGQPLTALGYPTPLNTFTVSPGSLLSFQVEDGQRVALVSDEITDYGSSGGPLLDSRGRVAGVVTEFAAHDGQQLVGLSYTYDFLQAHLDEIVASPTTVQPDCTGTDTPPLPDDWDIWDDWDWDDDWDIWDELGLWGDTEVDVYGDNAELDLLWDACADGDFEACDDLYSFSPVDSAYEAFGDSCGERNEPSGWCTDLYP